MPITVDYDFFVSYASADNREGWIDQFVAALVAEHRQFTGGRELKPFFDRNDIDNFSHWHAEIFNKGLTKARFFLAFLSPNYFASEVCRREWRAWIDQEISLHMLTHGAAPVYFVEVSGFVSKPMLPEHEVARRVAELCRLPTPHGRMIDDLAPLVKEFRRRQLCAVQPFYHAGVTAFRLADLQQLLHQLARHVEERVKQTRLADASANTVPAYNTKFTGRLDELVELRQKLVDHRAGVIAGIHGLGGIGKTELAFTFAHAYAGVYPGGRFYIRCEYQTSLRDAVLISLGGASLFHDRITDEERKIPELHFAAVLRCLRERIEQIGHVLLVLDNVTDLKLVQAQETDCLTVLGPHLHLLATTRLAAPAQANWLTLGELKAEEALALLEKFRPFADDAERAAAQEIVRKLGGFALAIELVAADLAHKPSATYAGYAVGLGLDDLDVVAEDADVVLRRHNHEKRLQAVLGPTLAERTPEERRVLEYAALLPPDWVPLPWLKELLVAEFPALAKPGKRGDPWEALCNRLMRLGLFTPVQEETTSKRQVRMHRLVQELLRRGLSEEERSERQERIDALVTARDALLQKTTNWPEARWELVPLDALAWWWEELGHPEVSWLMNRMGTRWLAVADWNRAEPLLRRSVRIEESCFGSEHPEVATALNNLAQLLKATNRLAEAEPLVRRALLIDEKSFGSNNPKVASVLFNLAQLLQVSNRLSEAEPLLRRVLRIDERNYGSEHSDVARDLNDLAQLLKATNRMSEAEPLMRRALSIDERNFGGDHPEVALKLNNLASLLSSTSRRAEAEPLMRRALHIDERSFGIDHPNVARDLNNLAWLLKATNRMSEAEPLMRRALSVDERSFGSDHPEVALKLNNLALLLQDTNRLAEAEPLMRRALHIDERSFGSDHPKVARDLNNLAQLLKATNRLAEAEPLSARVLSILIRFQIRTGHPHPHLETVVNNYAAMLEELGNDADAINVRLGEVAEVARRALNEE